MGINTESAYTKREHMGQMYSFCSQSCADLFDKDPHRYMTTSATTGFNPEQPLTRVELPLRGLASNGHSGQLESTVCRLEVGYDPLKVDLAKVVQTVKSAGYQVVTTN
jgi:YHS domain-containing protein